MTERNGSPGRRYDDMTERNKSPATMTDEMVDAGWSAVSPGFMNSRADIRRVLEAALPSGVRVRQIEWDIEGTAVDIARFLSAIDGGRFHEPTYNAAKAGALEAFSRILSAIETTQAPQKGREMTGFLDTLTEDQLKEAMEYRGEDDHPAPSPSHAEAVAVSVPPSFHLNPLEYETLSTLSTREGVGVIFWGDIHKSGKRYADLANRGFIDIQPHPRGSCLTLTTAGRYALVINPSTKKEGE